MLPQCFWGTWVMTEQWHGEYGWDEYCRELRGLPLKFTPTGFSFQDGKSAATIAALQDQIKALQNQVDSLIKQV